MSYDNWKTRSDIDDRYHGLPYRDICCDLCGSNEGVSEENDFGEFICESCIENANERAYERQMGGYYGGDGPLPLSVQQERARAFK
jgi:hypothetical protein